MKTNTFTNPLAAVRYVAKRGQHVAGGQCPHCSGTGRYRFHTDPTCNDKCFRCGGKGTLNERRP